KGLFKKARYYRAFFICCTLKMLNLKKFVILFAVLGLSWLVYANGLSGGFMLDDEHNISALSVFSNEVTIKKATLYFAESQSGPLKRPISIFSFLIDAQNWPADAYSFKRTNLIIHLINGGLLYFFLILLFKFKGYSENKLLYLATLSAGLWLLHPFLVSTTLYVVQRMAMLPVSFMLLGFVLYLKGRNTYQVTEGR